MVAILGHSRMPAIRIAASCTREVSFERLVRCLDDLLHRLGYKLTRTFDRAAVRERALSAFDALGPQTRVARDALHKRQVRTLICAFHYIVKITDGLVRVNEQNQVEFRQARTSRLRRISMIARVATKGEIQMDDCHDYELRYLRS